MLPGTDVCNPCSELRIESDQPRMPKILVIDDDDLVLETITAALEGVGYTVIACLDAREAIAHLDDETPNVLITDIFMPHLNGLEVVRRVHRSFPDLPIIAISGRGLVGSVDYLAAAQSLGASAVLRKPFRIGELAALVSQILA